MDIWGFCDPGAVNSWPCSKRTKWQLTFPQETVKTIQVSSPLNSLTSWHSYHLKPWWWVYKKEVKKQSSYGSDQKANGQMWTSRYQFNGRLNLRFFTGTAVFFLADLSPTANFLRCVMSVRNSCVLFPHPTVSHLLLTGWLMDNLLQKRAKLSLPVKKSRTLSHRYHHWKINYLYIKLPKFLFNKKKLWKSTIFSTFYIISSEYFISNLD